MLLKGPHYNNVHFFNSI